MAKAVSKKETAPDPAVLDNPEVSSDVKRSPTAQAMHNEDKAAKLKRDPNALDNPHQRGMSVDQAKEVVKRYGKHEGPETPADLQQANDVLKRAKA